ncbi:TPA: dATP/dGTP pyrophosphohydrolase domain-containing protein [Escherichia coli]
MTTNHPAHGPVSLDRLHQISEILSKASAQSDGGNLGYAMADAVKVIDWVIAREMVRREHAVWAQATFGDVGPIGPLKHLSKEALEAAADPGDLSEWADIQFMLWDAQRSASISDEQITLAMIEKLAVNKTGQWPEPKDGEPRLHIKTSQHQELERKK